MASPVRVSVKTPGSKSKREGSSSDAEVDGQKDQGGGLPKNLKQQYVIVPCKQKLVALFSFLASRAVDRKASGGKVGYQSTLGASANRSHVE